MRPCPRYPLGMAEQRAVQRKGLQIPQLDRLVCARGGQLLAVGGNEALQDVRGVGTELVQGLKVGGVRPTCRMRVAHDGVQRLAGLCTQCTTQHTAARLGAEPTRTCGSHVMRSCAAARPGTPHAT